MNEPILITGAARSGTSMVAGVMNLCGAFGGKMYGAHKANPKGMFENTGIREQIVKPYLRQIGADPACQYPLPDVNSLSIPVDWWERIEQTIQDQGYEEGPWFLKEPKMPSHWPVWHYAFPNARWLIVRRRTPDIIRSCMKTGFMNAFARKNNQEAVGAKDEREGWLWWVHYHEQRFIEMIQAGLNCKVVWPERMIRGDYTQMFEAVEWCGLKWSNEVYNFISPKLWKEGK